MKEVRREWGVMFADGSVRTGFNGRTAERRARVTAAQLRFDYYPDNIRAVSRPVYVGEWEAKPSGNHTP